MRMMALEGDNISMVRETACFSGIANYLVYFCVVDLIRTISVNQMHLIYAIKQCMLSGSCVLLGCFRVIDRASTSLIPDFSLVYLHRREIFSNALLGLSSSLTSEFATKI